MGEVVFTLLLTTNTVHNMEILDLKFRLKAIHIWLPLLPLKSAPHPSALKASQLPRAKPVHPTHLVEGGQVDLVTEHDEPFVELEGGEHDSVGGASVLAVVVKRLQHQLGGRGAREVESHHLRTNKHSQASY